MDEAVEAVKKTAVASSKAAGASAAGKASGTSGKASHGDGAASKDRLVFEKKLYMLKEARAFMPKVMGARLAMHTNQAWEAKYPTGVSPFSNSKSFTPGDVASSFASLQAVLQWAWSEHFKKTGERPHFDLGLKLV